MCKILITPHPIVWCGKSDIDNGRYCCGVNVYIVCCFHIVALSFDLVYTLLPLITSCIFRGNSMSESLYFLTSCRGQSPLTLRSSDFCPMKKFFWLAAAAPAFTSNLNDQVPTTTITEVVSTHTSQPVVLVTLTPGQSQNGPCSGSTCSLPGTSPGAMSRGG